MVESQEILRWRWDAQLSASVLLCVMLPLIALWQLGDRTLAHLAVFVIWVRPKASQPRGCLTGLPITQWDQATGGFFSNLFLGSPGVSLLLSVISYGENRISFLTGWSLLVGFDLISFTHPFIHSASCLASSRSSTV